MMEYVTLNNGVRMPMVGMGLWRVPNEAVPEVVRTGLKAGYRAFDTAAIYRNEAGLGEGLKDCGYAREDLFIATKLWNEDLRQGTEDACFQQSLHHIGVKNLDLCMIHWPVPGKYIHAWEYLIEQYRAGAVRAIGASNLHIHMMETMRRETGMLPMLLQVECHPLLSQKELLCYCRDHGIIMQAYSPLMQGGGMDIPLLQEMSARYGKSAAQIILRWHLQNGICIIPRSQNPQRQQENLALFDFELDKKDMLAIDSLNQNRRLCADPDNFDF